MNLAQGTPSLTRTLKLPAASASEADIICVSSYGSQEPSCFYWTTQALLLFVEKKNKVNFSILEKVCFLGENYPFYLS